MTAKSAMATVTFVVMGITMILPTYSFAQTTEDDGYTYNSDDPEEQQEQDEEEQEKWEDGGRPGDEDNGDDNNNGDDNEKQDEETQICPDGSVLPVDQECPQPELQICSDGLAVQVDEACPSVAEIDESQSFASPPPEELFDCLDGTVATTQDACELPPPPGNMGSCPDMPFYMVCEGITKHHNTEGKTKIVHKTTVIHGSSATATANANANANAADVSNCKLDGSANGIQQKFDTPKYLACGLYTDGQKAYSDGFVVGCTQIGNTQLVCQALVDSSILNTKTHPTQTAITQPTQTATQPTQAIQPATVSG
jgi:hypothetical protein